MTRETTMDKLFRADSDERHIESQRRRIEHLETIIGAHRSAVTFGDYEERPVDKELWDAMGETWEVEQ